MAVDHGATADAPCCPPAADVNLLKVPEGKRDEVYVFLSDILPTAWHANELGQVGEGDRVAIWGAGPGAPPLLVPLALTNRGGAPVSKGTACTACTAQHLPSLACACTAVCQQSAWCVLQPCTLAGCAACSGPADGVIGQVARRQADHQHRLRRLPPGPRQAGGQHSESMMCRQPICRGNSVPRRRSCMHASCTLQSDSSVDGIRAR